MEFYIQSQRLSITQLSILFTLFFIVIELTIHWIGISILPCCANIRSPKYTNGNNLNLFTKTKHMKIKPSILS